MKEGKKRELAPVQAKGEKKGSKSYFAEVKEEVQKVSWPGVDELKTCTKVVIGATFLFGLGIYLADLMIKGVLDSISLLTRLIFG